MNGQVTQEQFAEALLEMGHDPKDYEGKRLSLSGMGELYELDQEVIIDAIDRNMVSAHYDYQKDTIWVDALEAAHFYYCLRSKEEIFKF